MKVSRRGVWLGMGGHQGWGDCCLWRAGRGQLALVLVEWWVVLRVFGWNQAGSWVGGRGLLRQWGLHQLADWCLCLAPPLVVVVESRPAPLPLVYPQ